MLTGIAVTWITVSITTAEPKKEGFIFQHEVAPPGPLEYAVSFFCWAVLFVFPAAFVAAVFLAPRNSFHSRTHVYQPGQPFRYPQYRPDPDNAGATCTNCGAATAPQFFHETGTVLCPTCSQLKRST
jgi:hypothetical protein